MSDISRYVKLAEMREQARETEREYSRSATGAALEALGYPQKKLKQWAGGDDSEWFSPSGMPPELYAAGNT